MFPSAGNDWLLKNRGRAWYQLRRVQDQCTREAIVTALLVDAFRTNRVTPRIYRGRRDDALLGGCGCCIFSKRKAPLLKNPTEETSP
jgi:hypothetical protein